MKAHGEVPGSVRSMRNLRHQQLIELRVGRMGVDHGLNHGAYEILDRRCSVFDELGLNHAIDLVYVTLMQGCKDRALVGEVLV